MTEPHHNATDVTQQIIPAHPGWFAVEWHPMSKPGSEQPWLPESVIAWHVVVHNFDGDETYTTPISCSAHPDRPSTPVELDGQVVDGGIHLVFPPWLPISWDAVVEHHAREFEHEVEKPDGWDAFVKVLNRMRGAQ